MLFYKIHGNSNIYNTYRTLWTTICNVSCTNPWIFLMKPGHVPMARHITDSSSITVPIPPSYCKRILRSFTLLFTQNTITDFISLILLELNHFNIFFWFCCCCCCCYFLVSNGNLVNWRFLYKHTYFWKE